MGSLFLAFSTGITETEMLSQDEQVLTFIEERE